MTDTLGLANVLLIIGPRELVDHRSWQILTYQIAAPHGGVMAAAQGTNVAQAQCRSEAPIPTLLLVLVLVGFQFPLTSSRLSATDTGVFLAS